MNQMLKIFKILTEYHQIYAHISHQHTEVTHVYGRKLGTFSFSVKYFGFIFVTLRITILPKMAHIYQLL
jgi:hypothetical protein